MSKCPSCQSEMQARATKCPVCGYEQSSGTVLTAEKAVSDLPTVASIPAIPPEEKNLEDLPTVSGLAAVSAETEARSHDEKAPAKFKQANKPQPDLPPSKSVLSRQRKRITSDKGLLITIALAVVLAATGVVLWITTHPQPEISLTSTYNDGGLPVAASGISLRVRGSQFTPHSLITFLLDNQPVSQSQRLQSNSSGELDVALIVTDEWQTGRHTLSARDATNRGSGGVSVMVVASGQAHTPGINGAPSNDISFTVKLNMTGLRDNSTPFASEGTLKVSGNSAQQAGSVCLTTDDNQDRTEQGTEAGTGKAYTLSSHYTCSGTYQGGKIAYAQKLVSAKVTFAEGGTCTLNGEQTRMQVNGTYGGNQAFAGIVIYNEIPSAQFTCAQGGTFSLPGGHGTWSGQINK